jgi:murein DD-endopeptidase MepM/ murein hydrolase activator NlpD
MKKRILSTFMAIVMVITIIPGGFVTVTEADEGWLWPSDRRPAAVSSGYGERWGAAHRGFDIAGTFNVLAARSGIVRTVVSNCNHSQNNSNSGSRRHPASCPASGKDAAWWGNFIVIEHNVGGQRYHTVYTHLAPNSITVREGETVRQGQIIGISGNTGHVSPTPHNNPACISGTPANCQTPNVCSTAGTHLHFEIHRGNTRPTGLKDHANDINSNPRNSDIAIGGTATNTTRGSITYIMTRTTTQQPIQLESPRITTTSYIGGKTVTITGQTGSTLRYTRNGGTTLSTTSNTVSFNITSTETISAHAVRANHINSLPRNETVTVTQLAAPTINAQTESNGILVTMTAASGATIHYTTNGTDPSTSSPRYTGGFRVIANTNVRAIAVQSGFVTSRPVSQRDIRVTVPGVPRVTLFETPARIAVGDPIRVRWDRIDGATSYQATLYRNNILVSTIDTTDTMASFILESTGQYQVRVRAVNFVGRSAESANVNIESNNPRKVTFKDWDDSVITELTVKFGTSPTYPATPSRIGHRFTGWSVSAGTPITEDTVITASYEIETYNVTFFDVDGVTQLGAVQRVQFENAATPPTNFNIDTGYRFAGWHITNDSAGKDLTQVTGNIRAVAAQTWANPNMPVIPRIDTARRLADGYTYEIDVSFTNSNENITRGRLITVLKDANDKMIASDISDIPLPRGTPGGRHTRKVVIDDYDADERATRVEVIIVGFDGSNTMGALSEIVTANIVIATEWTAWSDWSATAPPAGSGQTEQQTQFRARSYEFRTSTSSAADGWELHNTTSSTGDWSGWSRTAPASGTNRQIETRQTAATFRTQYNYIGFTNGSRWHFCAATGQAVHGGTWREISTGWRDTPIAFTAFSATQRCSCHGSFNGYYLVSPNYYYHVQTRQVEATAAFTEYRFRDTTHTYHFRRFRPWSDWSTTQVAGDQTETRTLHRFRNQIPQFEPNVVTKKPEYLIEGNLSGITENFFGRKATILVYQNLNTDPTASQLQYVGQTTIGANNSYSFEFTPKKEISAETGDFIVALALEGATRIVKVDMIEAPKPEFSVRFVSDGEEISSFVIEQGGIAIPPAVPQRTGYTFTGWSDSTTNMDSERTLTANWTKNDCVVVVVDFANQDIDMFSYKYGELLGVLAEPEVEGMIFMGWYTLVGEEKQSINSTDVITGNIIVIAEWKAIEHEVTFVDGNGRVINEQSVIHGEAARLPAPLRMSGMIFAGWSTDVEWWRVTSDLVVQPIFVFEETTEAPMFISEVDVNIDDDIAEIVNVVMLSSSTPNATIFYSINGSFVGQDDSLDETLFLPAGFDFMYSEDSPIIVTGDVTITMIAVADNMNISEVVVIELPFIELTWNDNGDCEDCGGCEDCNPVSPNTCTKCGAIVTTSFCGECGTAVTTTTTSSMPPFTPAIAAGNPTIGDALEILKYLAKLPNSIADVGVSPTIGDALEVLKFLAKLPSVFDRKSSTFETV